MSAPSICEQIFRRGIEISRHHFKGVYVCTIGKNAEVICTLYEGDNFDEVSDNDSADLNSKYGPLTFLYQGHCATLRPWNPRECVIAAGIRNLLVHFPIRPGTRIFALDCSLMTLSHIADTIGSSGHLVGVIDYASSDRPSQEELSKFLRRHSCAQVILEDVKNATLDRYERLLSVSEACRFTFLMALHPRLGEHSPAKVLATLGADSQKVCDRIFSFLQCNEVAKTKCLVSCHCPPEIHADTIREVVLTHIDIIHQWRRANFGKFDESSKKRDDTAAEDSDKNEDDDGDGVGDSTQAEKEEKGDRSKEGDRSKAKKISKSDADNVPRWVLMGLATDHIVANSTDAESAVPKLSAVVDAMKRLKSGIRTGLLAKEQLLLTPYFANRFLLLLRYAARRDERGQKSAKKMSAPPGLEIGPNQDTQTNGDQPAASSSSTAPTGSAMPLPSFLGGGGDGKLSKPASAPPGLSPPAGLTSPAGLAPGLLSGLANLDQSQMEILARQAAALTAAAAANAPANAYSAPQRSAPSPHPALELDPGPIQIPQELMGSTPADLHQFGMPLNAGALPLSAARGRNEANLQIAPISRRGFDPSLSVPGLMGHDAPHFSGMGDFGASGIWGPPSLPQERGQDSQRASLQDMGLGIWGPPGLSDRGNDIFGGPHQNAPPAPPLGLGIWGASEGGGSNHLGPAGRGHAGAGGSAFDLDVQRALSAQVEAQRAAATPGQRRAGPNNSAAFGYGQQQKGGGKGNFPPGPRHPGVPPGRFQ